MDVVGAASKLVVTVAVPSVGSSVADPSEAPPVIENATVPQVTGADAAVVRVAIS